MEIRNWSDRADLRAALAARDRAWRVGYRGYVEQAVVDAAVADPDADDLAALAADLESEAGKFLVAVSPQEGGEQADDSGTAADGEDGTANESADDSSDSGESDPDVLGYVRARWGVTSPFVDTMEVEIVDLYVDPARWREGVGSALLDAVESWSPGLVDGVALSVLESNDRARAFLEASGFERDGDAVVEIGGEEHDAAVYRRAIDRLESATDDS